MKALFKHLSVITQRQPASVANNTKVSSQNISSPFVSTTLAAVLLGVPQIPMMGGGKVMAQNVASCPAGTAPETIQFQASDSLQDLTQQYNIGGINTVLTLSEEFPTQVIDRTESRFDDGVYGGLPGTNLRLNIGPGKPPETGNLSPGSATLTIDFAQPVTLASPLTLLDIDQEGQRDNGRFFRDIASITATNNNSNVPVNLQALGPFTQVSGNTASGITENSRPEDGDANVSVTPQGSVDQIRILYTPGESQPRGQDQTIGLAPFTICAPVNVATIGDTVYRDTNGDGTQNEGEEGIGGINLVLTNPGSDGQFGTPDDTTETTTTDNNGRYNFSVSAGNYRVTVSNPPQGLNPTQTPPETIVVAAGENFDTADFGFSPQQTGSIGDTVYTDGNSNNVQDDGEEGIPGATVTLTTPGPDGQLGNEDDTTQTTTTNDQGIYTFPNLPAGNYRVTATSPREGDNPTQTQPNAVELQPGQNLDTVDFGFAPGQLGQAQGSLGDTVYNDLNNNGQQDQGEPGIAGVIVNYAGTGPDGVFGESLNDDDTSGRTRTDANGRYTFPNLPAGTYRVTINDPSQQPIQGLSQTQTPNNPITLNEGQNFEDADFGYTQATGTIGDTVYRDNNSDGTQNEGEPGIPNVEVTLVNPGPDGQFGTGDDTTQTTTTNENGIYSFPNVPIGNYRVTVNNPPEGLSPTQTPPSNISLQANQNFDTADFGFSPEQVGTIGDFVFFDNNGNSAPDGDESGIPNITLVLRDGDGNEIATTTTEEDGSYSFVAPPGTYTVTVTNPPSGLNPTLTQPNPVNLEAGQNIDTVDFGFQPPQNGSIGDTVFADVNANRIQDEGEPGVSGVVVRLVRPGQDGVFGTSDDQIDEQRTDNTETVAFNQNTPGQYTFNNLPPGDYQVQMVLPDGSILTTGVNPIPVTLEPNQNFVDADFGVRMTGLIGSIGDTVFLDANANGVQDFTDSNNNGVKEPNEEGEQGIPGVQLTLTNSEGNNFGTTTTNQNGNYTFNNLPLGNYTVEATRPTDFSPTTETTLPAQLTAANPNTNEVDFGFRPGRLGPSGPTNLRLVKRITNVLRGNTPISGVPFNSFEDDPNDEDDNAIGESSVAGITRLESSVQSGDIVEYTIYFLSEGGQALQNVRVCDLVPDNTTFVRGSINVNGGGNGADNGNFSSPLAPIPANFQNICRNGTPTNGAVLTNLGTLPAGGQFGFVRFRVRVN